MVCYSLLSHIFFLQNFLKNMVYKRAFVIPICAVTMFSSANILCVRFATMLSLCLHYAGYSSVMFVQFIYDFQLFLCLWSFHDLLSILQLLLSLFFFIWVEESFSRFWWKDFFSHDLNLFIVESLYHMGFVALSFPYYFLKLS